MASILLGFATCSLCGGKTHVKRREEPGKRAYNHCLDEHDKGCSHTAHCTSKAQEDLLLAKMRPVAGGGASATPSPSASPTASPAEEAVLDAAPASATPPAPAAAKPARAGLW